MSNSIYVDVLFMEKVIQISFQEEYYTGKNTNKYILPHVIHRLYICDLMAVILVVGVGKRKSNLLFILSSSSACATVKLPNKQILDLHVVGQFLVILIPVRIQVEQKFI